LVGFNSISLKNNKILLVVAGGEQPQSVKLFDFIKKTGSNIPFIWYTQIPFDQLCAKDFYDVNPFNGYLDIKQTSEDLFKLVREIILRKENIEVSKFVRIEAKSPARSIAGPLVTLIFTFISLAMSRDQKSLL